MFNVGPFEMLVLVAVALIVFGPDKLPQLAKDAARMLRTLRDLAQGARSQLNNELGPEFADLDLRSLNPRTAIRNALLGDEELPNLNGLNPREAISRALRGEDDPAPRTPAPAAPAPAAPAPRDPAAGGSASGGSAAAAGAAGDATYEPDPARNSSYPDPGAPAYPDPVGTQSYPDPAGAPYDPDAT